MFHVKQKREAFRSPAGVCLLCRLLPLPLVCFLPPSPRPPSPVGKGEIFGFLMQGAPPLASPGLNPRSTGSIGGLAPPAPLRLSPDGIGFFCRVSAFLSPSPLPPSPVGKGEIFGFLMQGASPLASPGLDGARHRHCLWETGSFGFKWSVGTRWGGGNPGCKKPPLGGVPVWKGL